MGDDQRTFGGLYTPIEDLTKEQTMLKTFWRGDLDGRGGSAEDVEKMEYFCERVPI